MTEISYWECDNCKKKGDIDGHTIGGDYTRNWIVVSRSEGEMSDLFIAREHHFCNDRCLNDFIVKNYDGDYGKKKDGTNNTTTGQT